MPEKFASQDETFHIGIPVWGGGRDDESIAASIRYSRLSSVTVSYLCRCVYNIFRDAREKTHTSRYNLTWRIPESDCDFYKAKRKEANVADTREWINFFAATRRTFLY